MERGLRWNSRGRASPAHVASWEGGQSAASQKSATCSGCWFCGFLVFASHTFKSGLNWQNNLKTFTSHELWICEMLFLVYKLTKLKFVLFLIPVLCSPRTLCRVVRSAVSSPTNSRCPCQQLKAPLHFGLCHPRPEPSHQVQFHFSHLQDALKVLIFNISNWCKKEKKKCVWSSLLSLFFGNHHCWEVGKTWMYKAYICQSTAFYKGFLHNIEEIPLLVRFCNLWFSTCSVSVIPGCHNAVKI